MEDERKDKKSGYLTRQGVAKLLGVSVPTIDRYIRDGIIPFKKLKGRVLFNEMQVRRFLFDDKALPRAAKEHLNFILRQTMEKADTYRNTTRRYLGLKRILRLFDKLEKLDKQLDSDEKEQTKRLIEDELNILVREEAETEKKERAKIKETLKEIKKEIK